MKTLLSWSSGKDSAWALHVLNGMADIEVAGLFTTLNEEYDRVAMHGVRRELLEAQARAAGLELHLIPIPNRCSNEIYQQRMADFVARMREEGIEAMAFGDLFLEDIRAYREKNLAGTGMTPLFPIWESDTHDLARRMIASGLKARITCHDPRRLDGEFSGREFDEALIADLPEGVDPCGENGEFHTIAYAGPMFKSPVALVAGEIAHRDGFVFRDFLPA